jgi:hypothetical protein
MTSTPFGTGRDVLPRTMKASDTSARSTKRLAHPELMIPVPPTKRTRMADDASSIDAT